MPADPESLLLPNPPPPRPARRVAAIGVALRRFDGIDEPVLATQAQRKTLTDWMRGHRPQVAVMASAALVMVIGVPAALIVVRDQAQQQQQPAAQTFDMASNEPTSPAVVTAPAPDNFEVRQEPPQPAARSGPIRGMDDSDDVAAELAPQPRILARAITAKSAPAAAAPPSEEGARLAEREESDSIVVTGTILRSTQKAESQVEDRSVEHRGISAAPARSADTSYARFLSSLQSAVRADDRRAILKLIDFPLRVNAESGPRSYPNARSVEGDFDRIFTPKVRQAILGQRPDRLFVRDQGAMVGDGELWFGETCSNAACAAPGPVRIHAVNP